jgi:hypothetical protein
MHTRALLISRREKISKIVANLLTFYDPNDLNHDAYSLYFQSNITLEPNFDVDDFDIM